MIDVIKDVEPEAGYGGILKVSEAESAMRTSAHSPHEDRVYVLRGRMQLRRLDQGPPYSQGRARAGPDKRHLDLREGEVRLGLR